MVSIKCDKFKQNIVSKETTIDSYDVLIIGSGVVAALIAHAFIDKDISCALLDVPSSEKVSTIYELDTELKQLSQSIDLNQKNICFKKVLDIIYQLDSKVNMLMDDCDYYRNPHLEYLQQNEHKGFDLYPGLLTYYSGVQLNTNKLADSLKKDLIQNNISVFEACNINTIDTSEDEITISINNNIKIKSKKIIISNNNVLTDFFETYYEERKYFDDEKCELRTKNEFNSDEVINCFKETNDYPNIYFNFDHGVIKSIMNVNFFSGLYLKHNLIIDI